MLVGLPTLLLGARYNTHNVTTAKGIILEDNCAFLRIYLKHPCAIIQAIATSQAGEQHFLKPQKVSMIDYKEQQFLQ